MIISCARCDDVGWVCENHPYRPFDGPRRCLCGGAGAPCPRCNQPTEGAAPRLPAGYKTEIDKDGSRH
jgi:hypothetical protein